VRLIFLLAVSRDSCQDISIAGKGAGLDGKRSGLWTEMFRIISEVQPRFALIENVDRLVSICDGQAFRQVLSDLAKIGYDAEWQIISAADVGAHHLRKRIWIVAYPIGTRRPRGAELQVDRCSRYINGEQPQILQTNREREISYTDKQGLQRWDSRSLQKRTNKRIVGQGNPQAHRANWTVEPDVGRVADGIPSRVDRLKGLGNAIVPQVAELIMRKIKAVL